MQMVQSELASRCEDLELSIRRLTDDSGLEDLLNQSMLEQMMSEEDAIGGPAAAPLHALASAGGAVVGAKVLLHGLKSAPLNGETGTVVSISDERAGVVLDGVVGPRKAVRFCNFIVLKIEEELWGDGDCASPSSLEFGNSISLVHLAADPAPVGA